MGIVDIELNRAEEVLDSVILDIAAIDEVLVLAANDDLPGDGDLVIVLIAQWRLLLVPVVECDGDGGFGHPSLAVLVDQLLQVGCSHVAQVGDAKEEADGVQNITLSRPEHQKWSLIKCSK